MSSRVEIALDNELEALSVPVMMDLLDCIHRDAQEEKSMEVFAESICQAMSILAELQKHAYEVLREVEQEKALYGERYTSIPHEVC